MSTRIFVVGAYACNHETSRKHRLPTGFKAAVCSDFPFVDLLDVDTAGTVGGGGFGLDTVVLFDAALAVLAACNEVYHFDMFMAQLNLILRCGCVWLGVSPSPD